MHRYIDLENIENKGMVKRVQVLWQMKEAHSLSFFKVTKVCTIKRTGSLVQTQQRKFPSNLFKPFED